MTHSGKSPSIARNPRSPPKLRADKTKHVAVNLKYILLLLAAALFTVQMVLIMRYRISSSLVEISSQQVGVISNEPPPMLPQWIQDYFTWHKEMRSKYPGPQLFTNTSAPPILIRTCLGLCGGLNDRLGQLPWDLYLANQTRRIYLIRWERPKPLEEFLVPNEIDWSAPDMEGLFGDMHAVRAIPRFFQDFDEERPNDDFWNGTAVDTSITRATTGKYKDTKMLRHRLLGHLREDVLEERLAALGETDLIHATSSFGMIFRALFKPSSGVQAQLNQVYRELNMSPGHYTAVHCRVRHPKATVKGVVVKGKNANYPADKSGLPWYGETKDFAVAVATHAILCARTLSLNEQEPIYFLSDSNDLVRYVAHELSNASFVANNASLFETNQHDAAALKAIQPTNIVAREASLENAHIDKQKGRAPPAYYGTFVDLLLAVNARCVTFGIGYYALFATKLSGTQCKLLYQEEAWGGKEGGKATRICTEENYKHLS